MDEALHMDTVDFEFVNSSGEIIKNNDPAKVKNFKYHMKAIGTHFCYPMLYNYLILINLIFETSHWTEDLILSLDEPVRIKNISNLSREMMKFGCSMIADSIGINHIGAMFQSLSAMQFLTKTGLLNFASPSITKIHQNSGEKFLTLIRNSFQEYCEYIQPDHDLIQKVILSAQGDKTYQHEIIFCMNNIWIQRYQKLIETIYERSAGIAPIITAKHFQSVLMTIVAHCDFKCNSQKDFICSTIGLDTFNAMEKPSSVPSKKSYQLVKSELPPEAHYWITVYAQAGRHMSNLLADKDLTLIFRLFLLFQQLPLQNNVLKTLEILLLKKISENNSLQCYQNGFDAINTFCESINDIAKSQVNLFQLSMLEPKMLKEHKKCNF